MMADKTNLSLWLGHAQRMKAIDERLPKLQLFKQQGKKDGKA